MLSTFNAILPVFLVIALGFTIRRIQYLPDSVWPALDQLCWFLLFPLLIILTLSQADLDSVPIPGLASALLIAVSLMICLLFALKPLMQRLFGLTDPGFTSFFQGTSRWNGFAALAIIQALYGQPGLVLGALSFAVIVPVLQVVNVIVLTLYGNPEGKESSAFSIKQLLGQLVRNPMLVSITIGISLNQLDWQFGDALQTTLELIAGSTLGLALMAVGAGLKINALQGIKSTIIISSTLKLIAMPMFIVFACAILSVTGLPKEVAVICGAAPTAGTAYIMAKQMGGDANMVAAIITFQTLAAVLTLPLMLYLT